MCFYTLGTGEDAASRQTEMPLSHKKIMTEKSSVFPVIID